MTRKLSGEQCLENAILEFCLLSPILCRSVNGPSYVPVLHVCYKLIFFLKRRGGSL